ncbi:MAG: AraC family transcriptional regulator [Bacteroidota bacterium]
MNNTTKKETLAREEHWFCQRTEELFKKDRVFLNPDLDLATLSKAYGISKRQLSVFTKTVFAKNVNELINFYRMNYVLQCLEEGQYDQYNILSIGFSAGFSSKSTFYRVFKKAMDHTPSEYIEQLQQKS